MKTPRWTWYVVFAVLAVGVFFLSSVPIMSGCPGSQVMCPGVGCVSGLDKCFAGSKGGPSAVFSKETFVNKRCPDGSRTDGPCLMEF